MKASDQFSDEEKEHLCYLGSMLHQEPTLQQSPPDPDGIGLQRVASLTAQLGLPGKEVTKGHAGGHQPS
jgi:hypothetical protein